MRDRDLQHPDITAAERTGYAFGKEPKVFCYCEECGGEIYFGEDYYQIRDSCFCKWCVEHTMLKEAE